jgi:CsoR family transcriptional regulator, copper-sensing transcriptional repressor
MHTSNKDKIVRRLKIVEGQVRGLQQLILKDTYCIDIITQTSAVKQALSNIEDELLQGHLGHCAIDQIQKGQSAKAIGEILKVYKLKRK